MLKGLRLLRGLPRNQGCAHTLACGIVHLQSPRQPVRCILIDHAGRALGPHEPSRPGRIPGGRMRVDGKQQLCFLTRAEAVRKEIALKSPAFAKVIRWVRAIRVVSSESEDYQRSALIRSR
jgi:hypothetical protein